MGKSQANSNQSYIKTEIVHSLLVALVAYVQTNNNISQWVFLSLINNPLDKIYVICHLCPKTILRKYSLNSHRELSTKSGYKKSYSE
jgi:hypothetical protein